MLMHAFSSKGGPWPPLGSAKGGPKIFKGGPPKFFSPAAAVTGRQRHLVTIRARATPRGKSLEINQLACITNVQIALNKAQ